MDETTPAVLAVGLVKDFGQQRAVDRVDLEVRRGQVFGVLGPNGAGTTTSARVRSSDGRSASARRRTSASGPSSPWWSNPQASSSSSPNR
jgi:ABC-type branched-subunit amino acid transport system ATPase component